MKIKHDSAQPQLDLFHGCFKKFAWKITQEFIVCMLLFCLSVYFYQKRCLP